MEATESALKDAPQRAVPRLLIAASCVILVAFVADTVLLRNINRLIQARD